MVDKLQRNIKLLNLIYIFKWFVLMLPITVLFFKEHDISATQIFTLTSIYAVSIVIFEVPSGYIADIWGRKNSIVLGMFLSLVGNLFFLFNGFYSFMAAEIFLGIGASFISGCDSALFYDSLISLKREKEFKKLIGKYRSYGNFSEGFAGLFGGFLASYALIYTVYGRILVLLLGFLLSFLLVEPTRKALATTEGRIKTLFKVIKFALVENQKIRYLILFSSILGAVTLNIAWYGQFFFKEIGLKPIYYGLVWSIIQFASGFYAILGYKYVNLIGKKKAMFSLLIFIGAGYFGLSFAGNIFVGLLFILICFFIRGVNLPVIGYYLHQELSSEMRATVISVKSLAVRFLYSILAPFYGFVIDKYSLDASLRTAGGVYLLLGIFSYIMVKKVMEWK